MVKILYKRSNTNKARFWYAKLINNNVISITFGNVGNYKHSNQEYIVTQKSADNELRSRYNDKIKEGCLTLEEIKDETMPLPVEDMYSEILEAYLLRYLPYTLSNNNTGVTLAMLAKTYTGKVWNKEAIMYGQFKINGIRCFIRAYAQNDIFSPYRLQFQSREGTIWSSLGNLESYLLSTLPEHFIKCMIDDDIVLDGELYLPNHDVNEINHFVKDATCEENKLIQYWCYDLAIEDVTQTVRFNILHHELGHFIYSSLASIDEHYNNKRRFVVLPYVELDGDWAARNQRNKFIAAGYEGLILRNPNTTYQFGRRRVGYMEKYKDAKEGDFLVIDIYKEPKRDLPILLCENDINREKFETRLSTTHTNQGYVLLHKKEFIGKLVHISFGERSGVNRLPFHVKTVEWTS